MYKWIITKDHTANPEDKPGTNMNAVGVSYSETDSDGFVTLINKTEFRMYDDDKNLYFEGFIYGDFDGFEPLDDFGAPKAGATTIFLFEKNKWNQV